MADTGKMDELKGRVKQAYGDLTGDQKAKTQGAVDKIAGKVKQGVEHAREKIQEKIQHGHK